MYVYHFIKSSTIWRKCCYWMWTCEFQYILELIITYYWILIAKLIHSTYIFPLFYQVNLVITTKWKLIPQNFLSLQLQLMIFAVVSCHTTKILNNNTFTLIFMNQPQLCDWVCMFYGYLYLTRVFLPSMLEKINYGWLHT